MACVLRIGGFLKDHLLEDKDSERESPGRSVKAVVAREGCLNKAEEKN